MTTKKKYIISFIKKEIKCKLKLTNNLNILRDILVHYFDTIYKIISIYNKKISVIATEDRSLIQSHFDKCKIKSGNINYCYYIFNYIADLYIQSNTNKLLKALNDVETSFNKLLKPNSKCLNIIESKHVPNDKILKLIQNAANYKNGDPDIETVPSDRLAKLTLQSNTRENADKLIDLSLKQIIQNMYQTALDVLNELPHVNNIYDLSSILNKDDRLFYVGILLINLSVIMFAMQN